MKVFVYVNAWKKVGDVDRIKVFSSADAARHWLRDHDPSGTAVEQEVSGDIAARAESDCWSC
jgi:hypothetical protein